MQVYLLCVSFLWCGSRIVKIVPKRNILTRIAISTETAMLSNAQHTTQVAKMCPAPVIRFVIVIIVLMQRNVLLLIWIITGAAMLSHGQTYGFCNNVPAIRSCIVDIIPKRNVSLRTWNIVAAATLVTPATR